MLLNSFEHIISKIQEYTSNCSITITGGEPLQHENWNSIVSKCLEKFGKVCICSNGIPLKGNMEKMKESLRSGAFLQLSLDGDENADARIRGNMHYNSTINTINELVDFSDRLIVSTSIDKSNVNSITNLIKKLNTLRFLYWKVSWIQSMQPQTDEYMMTSQEWNRFVDDILPLCFFRVKVPKLFDFDLFEDILAKNRYNQVNSNCGFGKQKIYIFPNGDVYPCSCYSQWKLGNILTDPADLIIENTSNLTNFNIPNNSACHSCRYKGVCHSGCPGYSIKVFGKIGYGDIRCPIVNQYYKHD